MTKAQASASTASSNPSAFATAVDTAAVAAVKKAVEADETLKTASGVDPTTFTSTVDATSVKSKEDVVTTVAPPAPAPATTSSAYATMLSVGTVGATVLSMMM